MGEPIKVYDKEGNEKIMYSPTVIQRLVESGELFYAKPKPLSSAKRAAATRKRRQRKTVVKSE